MRQPKQHAQGDVYTYEYGSNLYINLTNRCINNCDFCVRHVNQGVGGHELWIRSEPNARQVIERMGDLSAYEQIVFCGFGEPMMALPVLLEVAAYAKTRGKIVRINTNGLANLIFGEDVTPRLAGLADIVSVSLNAGSAQAYDEVCHSVYGLDAYPGLLDFAQKAGAYVPDVLLTVVDSIGEQEVERCRQVAKTYGLRLRVRQYSDYAQ